MCMANTTLEKTERMIEGSLLRVWMDGGRRGSVGVGRGLRGVARAPGGWRRWSLIEMMRNSGGGEEREMSVFEFKNYERRRYETMSRSLKRVF